MKGKWNTEFGKNLRRELKSSGWTQLDLADAADLTPAAVSQLVNDKREPSLQTIISIMDALNCEFEDLVTKAFGQ